LIALSFERVEAAKSRDIGQHPAVSRKVRKTRLAVIVVREWLGSILERSVNTRSAIREIQGTYLFVFPARRNSGRNKEVQGQREFYFAGLIDAGGEKLFQPFSKH